jgi:hypothetical protein
MPQISERITPTPAKPPITPMVYGIRTLNGELAPWRLRPRLTLMPEESSISVNTVRACNSDVEVDQWTAFLSGSTTLTLQGGSSHSLDLQAGVHSTAFLEWAFKVTKSSQISLKITYSEGYELEPRAYPFFRTKGNRLDAEKGQILGPYDEVTLDIPESQTITYEPFWFRTFRVMRVKIAVGPAPVELVSFKATQTNYPLAVKAGWKQPGDAHSEQIWDVSIRTMRNCMFDGYADCPFYEQLQ